jgi:hypothetical protein
VQGVLSGFVVLVLAVGLKYVFNRLWQRSLIEEAGAAMMAAEALGLSVQPLGYGAHVQAMGVLDGVAVQLVWSGGVRGGRTQLSLDGTKQWLPLVTSAELLHRAIGAEE